MTCVAAGSGNSMASMWRRISFQPGAARAILFTRASRSAPGSMAMARSRSARQSARAGVAAIMAPITAATSRADNRIMSERAFMPSLLLGCLSIFSRFMMCFHSKNRLRRLGAARIKLIDTCFVTN